MRQVRYGAANEKFGGIEFEPNVSKMLPRPYTAIGLSWLMQEACSKTRQSKCSSSSTSKGTKTCLKRSDTDTRNSRRKTTPKVSQSKARPTSPRQLRTINS